MLTNPVSSNRHWITKWKRMSVYHQNKNVVSVYHKKVLDFAQILQIWFQGMLRKFVQMGTKSSIECVRIEYKPHLLFCVIPVDDSI